MIDKFINLINENCEYNNKLTEWIINLVYQALCLYKNNNIDYFTRKKYLKKLSHDNIDYSLIKQKKNLKTLLYNNKYMYYKMQNEIYNYKYYKYYVYCNKNMSYLKLYIIILYK